MEDLAKRVAEEQATCRLAWAFGFWCRSVCQAAKEEEEKRRQASEEAAKQDAWNASSCVEFLCLPLRRRCFVRSRRRRLQSAVARKRRSRPALPRQLRGVRALDKLSLSL